MGFVILAVALLACAIIVIGMPFLAEPLLGAVAGPEGPSEALAQTLFTIAIFLPLAGAGWLGARLTPGSALRRGQRTGTAIGLGLLIGMAGVALATLHGLAAGIVGGGASATFAPLLFVAGTLLVLVQVGAEEIFFRGWLQPALVSRWGAPAGVAVASLGFAALHFAGGAMHPVSFVNLALGGMLFGLLALRQKGIAGATAAHFAWNWSESMVLGLAPNPGVGGFGSVLDLEIAGTPLWGGSAEGLNASLGMTAVLAALLLLTAFARRAPSPPVPAAA